MPAKSLRDYEAKFRRIRLSSVLLYPGELVSRTFESRLVEISFELLSRVESKVQLQTRCTGAPETIIRYPVYVQPEPTGPVYPQQEGGITL